MKWGTDSFAPFDILQKWNITVEIYDQISVYLLC